MNIRKLRQDAILELIASEPISTQDEFIGKLKAKGFEVTQATISRDIKELKLIKKIGANGKSTYHANETPKQKLTSKYNAIFVEALMDADYAQNICVIKTHVGMANAACAALDAGSNVDIVGTLAGDDTIFVLLKTTEEAKKFTENIKQYIGE